MKLLSSWLLRTWAVAGAFDEDRVHCVPLNKLPCTKPSWYTACGFICFHKPFPSVPFHFPISFCRIRVWRPSIISPRKDKEKEMVRTRLSFLKSRLSRLLRLSLPLSIRDSNLGRILTAEGDIWELLLGCCYGVYSKLDCEYSVYLFFCSSAPYIM